MSVIKLIFQYFLGHHAIICRKYPHPQRIGQMSGKIHVFRHLTDKRLENEKFKVSVKCLFLLIWIGHLTSIKKVGRYLAEITISWSLRNSDMSLGRWVSEENVIISKQTFRVVLYPLKRHRGQKFRNMAIGHALFLFKPSQSVNE